MTDDDILEYNYLSYQRIIGGLTWEQVISEPVIIVNTALRIHELEREKVDKQTNEQYRYQNNGK